MFDNSMKIFWETDPELGWEEFIPHEDEKNPAIELRVIRRDGNRITLAVRSESRSRVVWRGLRKVLYDNRHQFGVDNAGVEMAGSCVPLWDEEKPESIKGYEQRFRFTCMV